MMKRLSLILITAVAHILIGLKSVSSFTKTHEIAPFIKNANSEIVLSVNSNKTIECEARKPITWISKVWLHKI